MRKYLLPIAALLAAVFTLVGSQTARANPGTLLPDIRIHVDPDAQTASGPGLDVNYLMITAPHDYGGMILGTGTLALDVATYSSCQITDPSAAAPADSGSKGFSFTTQGAAASRHLTSALFTTRGESSRESYGSGIDTRTRDVGVTDVNKTTEQRRNLHEPTNTGPPEPPLASKSDATLMVTNTSPHPDVHLATGHSDTSNLGALTYGGPQYARVASAILNDGILHATPSGASAGGISGKTALVAPGAVEKTYEINKGHAGPSSISVDVALWLAA